MKYMSKNDINFNIDKMHIIEAIIIGSTLAINNRISVKKYVLQITLLKRHIWKQIANLRLLEKYKCPGRI